MKIYPMPLEDFYNRTFITESEEETFAIARELGKELRGEEIILLEGELGAGKTLFVKGLAVGAGVEDPDEVNSPSFTILNIYHGKFPIYHFDFYRVEENPEIELSDFIGEGLIVIEWADRLRMKLKGIHVKIDILNETKRKIAILIL